MVIVTQNNKIVNFDNVTQISIVEYKDSIKEITEHEIVADFVDGSVTMLGIYGSKDYARDVLSKIISILTAGQSTIIAMP